MRQDFPIFKQRPDLIYFDSAATSQKPESVILALKSYYETLNSNIHRSAHFLAEEATKAYEDTRQAVADFIHAKHNYEIVFTRNATESINLVGRSYGDAFLNAGDEILISKMEHHSNIVPWLQLKERKGVQIKYIDITPEGRLDFKPELITPKTKLVSITAMSNALGTLNDLAPIIEAAHAVKAVVLVDACQLTPHYPIDVQALDADFLVFSAHKMYGPTGVGVLYGKEELLNKMPPFLGGGEMIHEVFLDKFTPADLPHKFEAGTPNIADVIAFKEALNYIKQISYAKIAEYEANLTKRLLNGLTKLKFVKLVGPKDLDARGPVASFLVDGIHPHDVAEGFSKQQICIRAGHHCGQPLMDHFNVPATSRISLAIYNTEEEVDRVLEVLQEIYNYFK